MFNKNFFLYTLAKAFYHMLNVEVCMNTTKFLKKYQDKFSVLELEERIFYGEYSLKLVKHLSTYLTNISLFEINKDTDSEIIHDFRLGWGKKSINYISIDHSSIGVQNIIPEKLMKICGYPKNTKMYKAYTKEYQLINKAAIKKISSFKKYSEVSDKVKRKKIINPIVDLFYNTLSKRKKCANKLFNYLFNEGDRIVLKLYKNRHMIYDFGKEIDEVESYKMKIIENEIIIIFNNGLQFSLKLNINATQIKEKLSLKFHTVLSNIDEIFAI